MMGLGIGLWSKGRVSTPRMVQADTESIKGSRDAQSCAFDFACPTSRFQDWFVLTSAYTRSGHTMGTSRAGAVVLMGLLGLALNGQVREFS